jgi:antitoxin component of RelBE/YafQ-DinJ toxin-antitoxin module
MEMAEKEKARLGIYLDEELKKKAAHIKAETGYTLSEIIELLLEGTSESEILKLAKKQGK